MTVWPPKTSGKRVRSFGATSREGGTEEQETGRDRRWAPLGGIEPRTSRFLWLRFALRENRTHDQREEIERGFNPSEGWELRVGFNPCDGDEVLPKVVWTGLTLEMCVILLTYQTVRHVARL